MPNLRVLQLISSGYDHVMPWCPPGVVICNAPTLRAQSTSEAAVTLMLISLNDAYDWFTVQNDKRWQWLPPRQCLAGKSVLLVGYGSVGKQIEAMLSGFGVDIVRVARRARPGVYESDQMRMHLPTADVVVLALPLDETTFELFDQTVFAAMKPGALLVNVSRGQIVDTTALIDALRARRIRAALDVTDPEPLPDEHPLWTTPGVVISPHVGGNPAHLPARARRFVSEQIARFARGEDLEFRIS